MINQSTIDEVRSLREHEERLIYLSGLRDQVIDELAAITDKHHDYNSFYRINCASEILTYFKNNQDKLNQLVTGEPPS